MQHTRSVWRLEPESKRDSLGGVSESAKWVAGRYGIESTLGVGAQGRTFLAKDHETNKLVALKRLTLADASDWKTIELFEREGNALRALEHERIPGYIDAFSTGGDQPEFFLAQTYVEGENLQHTLDSGKTWSNEDLADFLDQMLSILVYLESRRPPVVHRDIKPNNIIKATDGTYHLIDFGAVQSELAASTGSSTVIGTGGFVPVEQLMGRATPASDQYALASTAVYLASGTHPSEMESVGLRLQFRRAVTLDPSLANLVERMLEPRPDRRYESAKQARSKLRARSEDSAIMKALPYELDRGRIALQYEEGAFVVEIQDSPTNRLKFRGGAGLFVAGILAGIGFFWNPIYALLGMPFLLVGGVLVLVTFQNSRERRLELERGQITVRRRSFGVPRGASMMIARDLVDVVAERDAVHLFDATQTVSLPHLYEDATEIANQIRVHAGFEAEE